MSLNDLLFKSNTLLNKEELDKRMRAIHDRLSELEQFSPDWQAEVNALRTVGLDRINIALLPAYQSIIDLADLGALWTASSETEVEIGTGQKAFTLPDPDRQRFAPPVYTLISAGGDFANAMTARLVSYNRELGELVVDVQSTIGAGTFSDWTIGPIATSDDLEALRTDAQGYRNDAETYATSAGASALTAQNQLRSFRSTYLGAVDEDPTEDGNGDDLTGGELYLNTVSDIVRVYSQASGWSNLEDPIRLLSLYASRSSFVANNAIGRFDNLGSGATVTVEGLEYIRSSSSTVIGDLPGWVPGVWFCPNHWKDNATPGTTDMSDALTNYIAYACAVGMGGAFLKKEVYGIAYPVGVPKICGMRLLGASLHKTPQEASDPLRGATEIRAIAPLSRLFAWDGDDAITDYSGLAKSFGCQGLILNGNNQTTYAFNSKNIDDLQVHDCRIIGVANGIRSILDGTYSGLNLPGGHRITNNNFGATSGVNIEIDGHTQDWIEGNWFATTGATKDIVINRSDKINVINNEFNRSTGTIFELNDSVDFERTKEIILVANKINAGSAIVIDDNRTNTGSKRLVFVGNAVVGGVTIDPSAMHNPASNIFSYTQDDTSSLWAQFIRGLQLYLTPAGAVAIDAIRSAGNVVAKMTSSGASIYFGKSSATAFAAGPDPNLATLPFFTADGTEFRAATGQIRMGSVSGPVIKVGTGSPEGTFAAPVGSWYIRTDGGPGTTLYVKETGTGNTGWVAK